MKKWQKILLLVIICDITYYLSFNLLNCTSLNDSIINGISFIFLILPIVIYILIVKRLKHKEEEISKESLKVIKLFELNKSYDFKQITNKKHKIIEREYSRKSLNRVTGSSIIKYHIENNINNLRVDIENAIYNLELLDKYLEEVKKISDYESISIGNYSIEETKK